MRRKSPSTLAITVALVLLSAVGQQAARAALTPAVTIFTPTTSSTYSTLTQPLSLAGYAYSGDGYGQGPKIMSMTWSSSQGATGTCSAALPAYSTSWSASSIPLALGENVITITASDSSGQRKTATLAITYSNPGISYSVTDMHPCSGLIMSDTGYIAGTRPDKNGNTQAVMWHDGKLTWLGTLGGPTSSPLRINNLGHVLGTSLTKSGETHMFLWRHGDMRDLTLDGLPGTSWITYDPFLNDLDQVITLPSVFDPWLWQNGSVQELQNGIVYPDLGPFITWGLSNTGTIVGVTIMNEHDWEAGSSLQFVKNDKMKAGNASFYDVPDINGINDSNAICGYVRGTFYAFAYANGTYMDLPVPNVGINQWGDGGVSLSEAMRINNSGQILGDCWTQDFSHALLWQPEGSFTDIGTLGGKNSAFGNNIDIIGYTGLLGQSGWVVGKADTPTIKAEPYVWDAVNGIRDLNLLVDSSIGWQIIDPHGIDDHGRILALGRNTSGIVHELLLDPLPPRDVSLSPSSGTLKVGSTCKFTTVYFDPNGSKNIRYCYLLISPGGRLTDAVLVLYDAGTNKLWIRSDDNLRWIGGFHPGAEAIAQNSACKLICPSTSLSTSGDKLTINWSIQPTALLAGERCSAWMLVRTFTDLRDGYKKMGDFNVK